MIGRGNEALSLYLYSKVSNAKTQLKVREQVAYQNQLTLKHKHNKLFHIIALTCN